MRLFYNLLVVTGIITIFWLLRRCYIRRTKLTPEELIERDERVRDLIRHSYKVQDRILQATSLAELGERDRDLDQFLETFAEICDPETLDRHRVRLQGFLDDRNVRLRARNF